jgi:hypothetical protein
MGVPKMKLVWESHASARSKASEILGIADRRTEPPRLSDKDSGTVRQNSFQAYRNNFETARTHSINESFSAILGGARIFPSGAITLAISNRGELLGKSGPAHCLGWCCRLGRTDTRGTQGLSCEQSLSIGNR